MLTKSIAKFKLRSMRRVSTHQAKSQLSKLLAGVERGEAVVILRRDKAIAKLVRAEEKPSARQRPRVGTVTSAKVTASADAFTPLDADALAAWGIA